MIPLDASLRPTWLFSETVHEGCDRGGYYEQADFAGEIRKRNLPPPCEPVSRGCDDDVLIVVQAFLYHVRRSGPRPHDEKIDLSLQEQIHEHVILKNRNLERNPRIFPRQENACIRKEMLWCPRAGAHVHVPGMAHGQFRRFVPHVVQHRAQLPDSGKQGGANGAFEFRLGGFEPVVGYLG